MSKETEAEKKAKALAENGKKYSAETQEKKLEYASSKARQDVILAVMDKLGTVSDLDKLKIMKTLTNNLQAIPNNKLGTDDFGRTDASNTTGQENRKQLVNELSELIRNYGGKTTVNKDGQVEFALDEKKLQTLENRFGNIGNEIRGGTYTGQGSTKEFESYGKATKENSKSNDKPKDKEVQENDKKKGGTLKEAIKSHLNENELQSANELKASFKKGSKDLKEALKPNLNENELQSINELKTNLKKVPKALKEGVKAHLNENELQSAKDIKTNFKKASNQISAELEKISKGIHKKLDHLLPGKHSESSPKPPPKGKGGMQI